MLQFAPVVHALGMNCVGAMQVLMTCEPTNIFLLTRSRSNQKRRHLLSEWLSDHITLKVFQVLILPNQQQMRPGSNQGSMDPIKRNRVLKRL